MAFVTDPNNNPSQPPQPVRSDGWVKGLDTVHKSYAVGIDSLTVATNVDINDKGDVLRRTGYEVVLAGQAHSLHSVGTSGFVGIGTELRKFNSDETTTTLVTGLSGDKISYVTVNGDTYWGNGTQSGIISSADTVSAWGIPTGPVPTVSSSAVGGLPEGWYQVGCSYVLGSGEEGGYYSTTSIYVTTGGITVALPAITPTGVTHINVYTTIQNGEVEYLYTTVPVGTTSVLISSVSALGPASKTADMYPFPSCTQLEYHKGRIYGVRGNVVHYTSPMRYKLTKLGEEFFMFPSAVQMVLSAGEGGLYISDETKTWWLGGGDPSTMTPIQVLPYSAIAGTAIKIPNSTDVMWFSDRGWIRGSADGRVENVMENSVLPGVLNDNGAALFREKDGIRQAIAIVDEAAPHSLTV